MDGAGAAVAGRGGADGGVVVSRTPEVASGAARDDCGGCPVGCVARGVVLITSGCPQLVSTNSSKKLHQRTAFHIASFRTNVRKIILRASAFVNHVDRRA